MVLQRTQSREEGWGCWEEVKVSLTFCPQAKQVMKQNGWAPGRGDFLAEGKGQADAEGSSVPGVCGEEQEPGVGRRRTVLGRIKLHLLSGVRWKPQEELGLRHDVI